VSYGHVLVDGKRVDKPSYLVTPGESVTLTPKALLFPDVVDELKAIRPVLSWLKRDGAAGVMTGLPNRDEIGQEIDESLIIEFYSR
jgi:small subunit ribosomal protein S4